MKKFAILSNIILLAIFIAFVNLYYYEPSFFNWKSILVLAPFSIIIPLFSIIALGGGKEPFSFHVCGNIIKRLFYRHEVLSIFSFFVVIFFLILYVWGQTKNKGEITRIFSENTSFLLLFASFLVLANLKHVKSIIGSIVKEKVEYLAKEDFSLDFENKIIERLEKKYFPYPQGRFVQPPDNLDKS